MRRCIPLPDGSSIASARDVVMLVGIVDVVGRVPRRGLDAHARPFAFFRGLLGLSEPTAFPAQLRVVTTWFPGSLRATANSVSVAGGTFGAIIAPPLVAWLALSFNWHAAFLVPGAARPVHRHRCGISSTAIRRTTFSRRRPRPPATRERTFTWPQLWRTRTLWGILAIRFISDPVWYFCLFWLPGYLQENSGLTLAQVGMVGWIPFLAADLGGIASAAWSDRMVRRGTAPLLARKRMLTAMAMLAPLCVLTPHLPHPAATLAIFSLVAAAALSWLFSLSVVIAETFPIAQRRERPRHRRRLRRGRRGRVQYLCRRDDVVLWPGARVRRDGAPASGRGGDPLDDDATRTTN